MSDSRRARRSTSGGVAVAQSAPPASGFATPPAPAAAPRSGTVLGTDPGQTRLRSPSPKPPLGRGGSPLPALSARQQKARGWWTHPAFIVSGILTFLSIAGMAVWMIVSALTAAEVVVTGLTVTVADDVAHVDWEGPKAVYSLYAISGDGAIDDLSTWVRGGTDAWLPMSAGLWDPETCFVVREAGKDAEITLGVGELAAQGAQSTCIADASRP